MSDPLFLTTGAAALELAINRALSLDPGTQLALAKLENRILAVELTAPQLTLFIRLGNPVGVLSQFDGEPDCGLKGTALGFVTLMQSGHHNLATSAIEQTGDLNLLRQLLQIVADLDLDWEQPLVKLFGDLPGHGLATAWRNHAHWWRQSATKAPFFIGDYLTHELGLIPSAEEQADFCQQVDELRADTDRLSARVSALQNRLNEGAAPL